MQGVCRLLEETLKAAIAIGPFLAPSIETLKACKMPTARDSERLAPTSLPLTSLLFCHSASRIAILRTAFGWVTLCFHHVAANSPS